jgi:hypothetical protein
MKEFEMLKVLAKHEPGEQVTIHATASGQFVVATNSGGFTHAPTLEEAISNHHARLIGFEPATIPHSKKDRVKAMKDKVVKDASRDERAL